jgi:acetyltransferase-like isoleucine patch superfamily enzyme
MGGDMRDTGWEVGWEPPEFDDEGMTKWGWKVQHPGRLVLGKHTDIGAFSYINAKFGVEISDKVQIGSHCAVYSVSTIDGKKGKVTIGRNARIGSHSVVLPGVCVGEGSIIGAFSLVNRDIPAGVVAFGVPAKVHRKLTKKDRERFGVE